MTSRKANAKELLVIVINLNSKDIFQTAFIENSELTNISGKHERLNDFYTIGLFSNYMKTKLSHNFKPLIWK